MVESWLEFMTPLRWSVPEEIKNFREAIRSLQLRFKPKGLVKSTHFLASQFSPTNYFHYSYFFRICYCFCLCWCLTQRHNMAVTTGIILLIHCFQLCKTPFP